MTEKADIRKKAKFTAHLGIILWILALISLFSTIYNLTIDDWNGFIVFFLSIIGVLLLISIGIFIGMTSPLYSLFRDDFSEWEYTELINCINSELERIPNQYISKEFIEKRNDFLKYIRDKIFNKMEKPDIFNEYLDYEKDLDEKNGN